MVSTFWKPKSKVWFIHNSDKKLGKKFSASDEADKAVADADSWIGRTERERDEAYEETGSASL